MRRALVAIASTIAGLVLLLSFKTHGTPTTLGKIPAAVAPARTTTAQTTTRAKTTAAAPTTTAGAATAAAKSGTATGDVIGTQYGPVQVRITYANGQLTAARATQYPSGDAHSYQISAYAIPILNQETVQVGNASIQMVSGASYTSDGYIASLQSALSKAGLA